MSLNGQRQVIEALYDDYVETIDEDRLEDWVELFVEDCVYKIIPRENVSQNLPLPLLLLVNKDMLRDRILSLREANIYNIHTDRHVVGRLRIRDEDDGAFAVRANYALFQTSQEGETRIFSVGVYEDKVVLVDGTARFKEKIVVVDTASVPTLLSTPI